MDRFKTIETVFHEQKMQLEVSRKYNTVWDKKTLQNPVKMNTKRSKQKQNCGSYGLLFGSGGFRKSSGGFFGNRRGSGGFWFWWF